MTKTLFARQVATLVAQPPAMPLVEQSVTAAADPRWVAAFEERYGEGTFDMLLAQLRKPCVTFAEIATRFGVTRENVRQWHQRVLPGAPRGHERQRLCRLYQQKRRLLSDALLVGFYRRVRADIPAQRIRLIASRDGFRKRLVQIDGALVALKRARTVGDAAYVLGSSAIRADFTYYELGATDYLLVPRHVAPSGPTTFRDSSRSKYHAFKNTFAALSAAEREARVS